MCSILSTLTDLANYSSIFDVISDIDDTEIMWYTTQTEEISISRTTKQNEIPSFSGDVQKGNASKVNVNSMRELKWISSNNLKEKGVTVVENKEKNWKNNYDSRGLSRRKTESIFRHFTKFNMRKMDSSQNSISDK